MRLRAGLYALATLALLAPRPCIAQERGATALGDVLAGLPVSVRVLVIAAHPDDEDTRLITWLQKGRHADVAYLSLTRGDGGQNLIGNELGEALGVIRTEELLAARRIDGAQQYFTRAYDFGFSKSATEAYTHWPHDTLLANVVTVVRAFRPQIIIAVFSGTPRDGHGQHQVSGILAREAYDAAGDGARFPASATAGLAPWTPLKFYRTTSYWQGAGATFHYNAGEYSPLLGRSYAEIAGESRSQHLSQGFGALQRKGFVAGSVRRESSRAPAPADPNAERSIFDGIDTTYRRLGAQVPAAQRPRVDSLVAALGAVASRSDLRHPETLVPSLEHVQKLASTISVGARGDVDASLAMLRDATSRATALAAGIGVEAAVPRDALALGDTMAATVTVYDRNENRLMVDSVSLSGSAISATAVGGSDARAAARTIPRDSSSTWTFNVRGTALTGPWWLTPPRTSDLFASLVSTRTAEESASGSALAKVYLAGGTVVRAPLVLRVANPARGEEQRPLAVVPAVSVTLDRAVGFARAGAPVDRELRVTLRSAYENARDVNVRLDLPQGLLADTASRSVSLAPNGVAQTVAFRVRGTLPAGRHVITAVAESEGTKFDYGYVPIRYEHIRPQMLVRPATMAIEAVDAQLPHGVSVAYVQGVGDNSAPLLEELGIPVTVLDAHTLASADVSRFTTVVIGTRAYQSDPTLAAQNPRLFDWVKQGGTMVVQYGQGEMAQPGMMPYPISLSSPAARVTDEGSPITVLAPNDPLLSTPNRITDADWRGWVQDRALYMPSTIDPHYQTVIATNDPGEPQNPGGILRVAVGRGSYIYTTLAFFRQLPAGVPGAARLFVNLLGPPITPPSAAARAVSP
ncbi:MAG: PIG-L family deacetylase [Gemmatimonadota bacterium]